MPGPTIDLSRVGELADAPLYAAGRTIPSAIAATVSPQTITAGADVEEIYVQAAAGSTVTVAKKGVTLTNQVQAAATNSTVKVTLGPGETCVVTYTANPTMARDVP